MDLISLLEVVQVAEPGAVIHVEVSAAQTPDFKIQTIDGQKAEKA